MKTYAHEQRQASQKQEAIETAGYLKSMGVNVPEDPAYYAKGYQYLRHGQWPELEYPQLVLVAGDEKLYSSYRDLIDWKFSPDRDWYAIAHQAGGMNCTQHYYVATFLKVQDKFADGVHRMTNSHRWCGTNLDLDVILNYRAEIISQFEVDCVNSFRDFEEGIYPIDLCFLGHIAEGFPNFSSAADGSWLAAQHLQEALINRNEDAKSIFNYHPPFRLFILGDNCD